VDDENAPGVADCRFSHNGGGLRGRYFTVEEEDQLNKRLLAL